MCKKLFAKARNLQGDYGQMDLVAFPMLKSGKVISEILSEAFMLKETQQNTEEENQARLIQFAKPCMVGVFQKVVIEISSLGDGIK